MITLTDEQIQTLLNNMAKDNIDIRTNLALIEDPKRIEFSDENGRPFASETVARIHAAARARSYHCYSCDEDKPIAEWSRDSSNVDLCQVCLYEAELENEHSDGYHDEINRNCPSCQAGVAP